MSRWLPRRWWPLAIALLVVAAVLALYLPTRRFDFHIDDFVSLRPWPPETLWRSLTGPWHEFPDAPGFYRPVSVLYYALAFDLFGVNTAALHLLPPLVITVAGALVGLVVWRETTSRFGAAAGAVLYVIHPGTSIAVGPWIANQYQGFATILALVAMLMWQRRRTAAPVAWVPLLVPLVLAGWLKEDALMLPLVLVAAHGLIAWWTGTLPPPPRAVVIAAFGLFAALNLWRLVMLGGLGGYETPAPVDLLLNLLRGPYFTLVVQLGSAPWMAAATIASVLCSGAAVIGACRDRSAPGTRVTILGLTLMAIANVPLALMTSMARSYLLTLGAVLTITAGTIALQRAAWVGRRRVVALAGMAVAVVSFMMVSRERIGLYAPCSAESRHGYAWIRDERPAAVATEVGPWLDAHIQSCDAATYRPIVDALPVLTWRRDRGDTTVLVTAAARAVHLRVRAPMATAASPSVVDIQVNGAVVHTLTLSTTDWATVPLPLERSLRATLRRSHRIDVRSHGPGIAVETGAIGY